MIRILLALALAVVWLSWPASIVLSESLTGNGSLVDAVMRHSHISESLAKEHVERVFSAIRAELREGRGVDVPYFGRFRLSERSATRRAPRNGKRPKREDAQPHRRTRSARFSASASLKEELNGRAGSSPSRIVE